MYNKQKLVLINHITPDNSYWHSFNCKDPNDIYCIHKMLNFCSVWNTQSIQSKPQNSLGTLTLLPYVVCCLWPCIFCATTMLLFTISREYYLSLNQYPWDISQWSPTWDNELLQVDHLPHCEYRGMRKVRINASNMICVKRCCHMSDRRMWELSGD